MPNVMFADAAVHPSITFNSAKSVTRFGISQKKTKKYVSATAKEGGQDRRSDRESLCTDPPRSREEKEKEKKEKRGEKRTDKERKAPHPRILRCIAFVLLIGLNRGRQR
jgi:hypothetical protein